MLIKEYFDVETNKVSTTSMTSLELLREIENIIEKFRTDKFTNEITIHALVLASIFPQDDKNHFNEDRYFISLAEYSKNDIDLILYLLSEKYNIQYGKLKFVYEYILNRYTIEYYNGGVRRRELQLPTYNELTSDLILAMDVRNTIYDTYFDYRSFNED